MDISYIKKQKLPDKPGVYRFFQGKNLLYIGKATSLKDRVRSYFSGDLGESRGPKIIQMLALANKIEWQETDSVLEALLLETELIKKHQPKYNSREKDDKSYWYVVITDEDFPRVLPIRGRELQSSKNPYLSKSNFVNIGKLGTKKADQFGPFPYANEIKEALKIIRKIFPYRDTCIPAEEKLKKTLSRGSAATLRGCFNHQIGLCPGVCAGEISKTEYRKIVRNIKLLFSGKKKEILKNLEKEMKALAKKQEFEKAGKIRDQIFALNHIRDVSLLKDKGDGRSPTSSAPEVGLQGGARSIRIEAYDIAHLSGTNTTGAMVVWQNGEMDKSEYKKFKLRGGKSRQADDPANLREILERRFAHTEWPMPDIVVVDGNQVQMSVADEIILPIVRSRFSSEPEMRLRTTSPIFVIGVTKDSKHKAAKLVGDSQTIHDYHQAIVLANSEAHRFALSYHRKLRGQLL